MQLLSTIGNWPAQRWPWLLLGISALALELVALYFQYGMGLEPCVMCIYQRVAVAGLAIAGFVGAIAPQNTLVRLVAFIAWFTAAIWGLFIAYEHMLMQNPDNFMLAMSCDAFPNFPSWMAIHEWFPAIFEARGTCDTIDWQFLGQSMPSWMVVSFTLYTVLAVVILLSRVVITRKL